MRFLAILIIVITLAGCTTAGPFVTSISSDGKGGIIVQKGYAEYNAFLGTLSNKEAGETNIKLIPEK